VAFNPEGILEFGHFWLATGSLQPGGLKEISRRQTRDSGSGRRSRHVGWQAPLAGALEPRPPNLVPPQISRCVRPSRAKGDRPWRRHVSSTAPSGADFHVYRSTGGCSVAPPCHRLISWVPPGHQEWPISREYRWDSREVRRTPGPLRYDRFDDL